MATEGFAGETVIDCRWGGITVTVRLVEPLAERKVALSDVVPIAKAEASPPEIAATAVSDEFQVAAPVRSCVLLSLYVPVAVNCWLVPTNTDEFAGVTAMLVKTALVTLRTTELLIDPDAAVIVVWPAPDAVARPAALIVATEGVEEIQLTEVVRSWVLPSLNKPVAVNC